MANNGMTPMPELEPLSQAEREDYYATIGQMLADEEISEAEAANLIFGPDVSYAYHL